MPLVTDTDVSMEVSGFAALSLGLVFTSTCKEVGLYLDMARSDALVDGGREGENSGKRAALPHSPPPFPFPNSPPSKGTVDRFHGSKVLDMLGISNPLATTTPPSPSIGLGH